MSILELEEARDIGFGAAVPGGLVPDPGMGAGGVNGAQSA